ncbi:MAG: hypothetical protein WC071_00830, partial [Victivallaceae bacterium]
MKVKNFDFETTGKSAQVSSKASRANPHGFEYFYGDLSDKLLKVSFWEDFLLGVESNHWSRACGIMSRLFGQCR